MSTATIPTPIALYLYIFIYYLPAYYNIVALLTTVSEELPDVPLFLWHNLCRTLKCTSPSAVIFRSAALNAGYRISGTHASPLGLKTDSPMSVIWDIMRCCVKNHPVKLQTADKSGTVILSKEPEIQQNDSGIQGRNTGARLLPTFCNRECREVKTQNFLLMASLAMKKYILVDLMGLEGGTITIALNLTNDIYVVGYLDKFKGNFRSHIFKYATLDVDIFLDTKGNNNRLIINYESSYSDIQKNARIDRS